MKIKSYSLLGGTGNPFFSTDSAAALRRIQIKASLLVKATKHNGIFDKGPAKYADAKVYESLRFTEVLKKRLAVMDMTAFDLCYQHHLSIRVFDMGMPENLLKIAKGDKISTLSFSVDLKQRTK